MLALNEFTFARRIGRSVSGDGVPYLSHFPFDPLVHHIFNGQPDEDLITRLRDEVFSEVRQSLGVPNDQPLITVVVGSHGSIASALKCGECQGFLELNPFFLPEKMHRRKLVCLLGAVLERLEDIDLRWLSDVVGEMRPTTLAPEFDDLAREVRNALRSVRAQPLSDASPTRLKLPASPRIYVRKHSGAPWEPFPVKDRQRGAYSVTSHLIQQFGTARKSAPHIQGVLLKVLADDDSRHSPADAPMITAAQRIEAKAAGLTAVLLDRRRGVIRPPGPGDRKLCEAMPVYAV